MAEYRAGNYLISAVVKGTAEKPTLTLASDPQLDQADILSVLLFNKPLSSPKRANRHRCSKMPLASPAVLRPLRSDKGFRKPWDCRSLGLISQTFQSLRTFGKYGQEVSAEYRITSDWRFSVSASTVGPAGADLIWQKRY